MTSALSAAEPAANGGLLVRLRQLGPTLPTTASRIAAVIAQHPEEVLHMSITELAERAAASEGSVVAVCRRFGTRGFQDLKIVLARSLVDPVATIQPDLRDGDDATTVADRVFAAHAASLADTRRLLDIRALSAAVRMLRCARRIEAYGIGSAAPVAEDLAYRLLQLGLDARPVLDSHIQAVSAAMTDACVATVTISHSGSTVETVLATRLAKEAGAGTIGITRIGKSPLQRYCDILLYTAAAETQYRPEAMSSRVAQLAIVDTLVSCCALADPGEATRNLERSMRAIAEKRF
jgi:DNA-binding MurR/RpiR family transcriptional regulator